MEDENRRLKHLVVDLIPDKEVSKRFCEKTAAACRLENGRGVCHPALWKM